MIIFSCKIGKSYALDIVMFHPLRSFRDGISLLNVIIGVDWYKGDHNPKVLFHIIILNATIIEINLYNTRHVT
jgi:hypothetical protein